jgi:diacylglycerol kinase (ATP)
VTSLLACDQGATPHMADWLAIVNPHSGGARDRLWFRGILARLERVADRIVFTEGPGHAEEIASHAACFAGLAAVGGDGTLHEILAGTARRMQPIALVPTGRGNSLARDLGLSSALDGIHAIETRISARIDLMKVVLQRSGGRRRFCHAASTVAVGYPVAVTQRADRSFRSAGTCCYVAAAIVESARPRRFAIELSCEGAPLRERALTGFIVNNTRHLANFVGFPDARYDDGKFEVMELDAGLLRQSVHNLAALCGGRFGTPPARHARAVDARFPEPTTVMVDGQIYPGVTSLQVRIAPSALACFRGASGADR